MLNKTPPITMFVIIAAFISNSKNGIMNIDAKMNLKKNVENVDCHTSFLVCLFSPSSLMCIPNASEHASAIVSIPPTTASSDFVALSNPIISPNVVITARIIPKLKPTFHE